MSDLEILLRHRVLLFGIIGGFVFYSLFVPTLQWPAILMAGVSMVGYLLLMAQVGGYNEALARVMWVDVVGVVLLLVAIFLKGMGSAAS